MMVTLAELCDQMWRYGESTEGPTTLQHSTDLGLILVWPDSILSSVKTHENILGICKRAPKGLRLWETTFSGLMNLNSKHHIWREPALLITCRVAKCKKAKSENVRLLSSNLTELESGRGEEKNGRWLPNADEQGLSHQTKKTWDCKGASAKSLVFKGMNTYAMFNTFIFNTF